MRDDGYDISDYRSIDPRYGTLDEFKPFSTPPTGVACRS
jgi:glycosidase